MREGEGKPHPAELRRPHLTPDCDKYLRAYRSISAGRHWGPGGPLPLSLSEVHAYLGMSGIEDHPTKLKYMRLVQRMDEVELKNLNRKSK